MGDKIKKDVQKKSMSRIISSATSVPASHSRHSLTTMLERGIAAWSP